MSLDDLINKKGGKAPGGRRPASGGKAPGATRGGRPTREKNLFGTCLWRRASDAHPVASQRAASQWVAPRGMLE